MTAKCIHCGRERQNGPTRRCESCVQAAKTRRQETNREWRKSHRAHATEYTKKWRISHPTERKRHAAKAWTTRAAKPGVYRAHIQNNRFRMHAITAVEFERMLAERNKCCWLCGVALTAWAVNQRTASNIDHDHTCTSQANHRLSNNRAGCPQCVRGLICSVCNCVVVRFLELYPDRRTAAEHAYMSDRPILRYRAEGRPA